IKAKGRMASLLEVGTGFHPDLTGRENVFLNGAILGMSKSEIKRKFDEIVDFSGVEKYIDTPVKRYSSGMYVRLAFAVAAHLESEILIIDEVLAVGDSEFQKKCISKMSDVANSQGRTVLFVSHNMNAVSRLCNKGLLLTNGTFKHFGPIEEITEKYLELFSDRTEMHRSFEKSVDEQAGKDICLTKAYVSDLSGQVITDPALDVRQAFYLNFTFVLTRAVKSPKITFHFKNKMDDFVWFCDMRDNIERMPSEPGIYSYRVLVPQPLLKPDIYNVYIGITNEDNNQTNHFANILRLEFVDLKGVRENRAGFLYTESKWDLVSYLNN
ncbi:MAG TPA: hypothetical protein VL947_10140, partial [Cytophagales bacterium]|nr:hypothetical protein [Cytophagales bacterium]